jgi:hypothetical protein
MRDENLSYNKRQLKERPTIRQIAEQFLNDELRAQLEVFLQYIEGAKMPLSLNRCNTYQSNYKGKPMFRIEIANGQACQRDIYAVKVYAANDGAHFRDETKTNMEDAFTAYTSQLDDDMKDYFLSHFYRCRGCGKCRPGAKMSLFDKEYTALCACNVLVLRVDNPSADDYEMIKRLIAARKDYILQTK